jgi:hypothetical protein
MTRNLYANISAKGVLLCGLQKGKFKKKLEALNTEHNATNKTTL